MTNMLAEINKLSMKQVPPPIEDYMYAINENHEFIFFSDSFAKFYKSIHGVNPELQKKSVIFSKPIHDIELLSLSIRLKKSFRKALNGKTFQLVKHINTQVFKEFYYPIFDSTNRAIGCVVFGNQLIEHNKSNSELQRNVTELKKELKIEKEKNKTYSKLVNMTYHEIKTPIFSILSSIETIESYISNQHDESLAFITQKMRIIQTETNRIANMINHELTIDNSFFSQRNIIKEEINLLKLIETIIERQNRLQKDNRKVELSVIGEKKKSLPIHNI